MFFPGKETLDARQSLDGFRKYIIISKINIKQITQQNTCCLHFQNNLIIPKIINQNAALFRYHKRFMLLQLSHLLYKNQSTYNFSADDYSLRQIPERKWLNICREILVVGTRTASSRYSNILYCSKPRRLNEVVNEKFRWSRTNFWK